MAAFHSSKPEPLTAEQRRVLDSLSPAQRRALVRAVGVRRKSEREFLGLPLYAIALGPDPERGEVRGHAKAVFAVGDIATGVVAVGGWARGVFALGGLATGLVAFGGLSVGLLAAFGGLALSALLAVGGGAIGTLAIGGASLGHYAVGGSAFGNYVVGPQHVDPEALELFESFGFAAPHRTR